MSTSVKLLWGGLAFGVLAVIIGLSTMDVPPPSKPVVKNISTSSLFQ